MDSVYPSFWTASLLAMEESIAILLAGTLVELYGYMSTTILHFGPAHPAAHGVLRSILWLSGEWVTNRLPILLIAFTVPRIATPAQNPPRPWTSRTGVGFDPIFGVVHL